MIAKQQIIDLAFRCSIFGLLIYKIYDLGKRYFLPYLNKEIASHTAETNGFLEKEKLIISTRLRIENQIHRQQQMFIALENNVQQWHSSMLALQDQLNSLQRQRTQQLQEKRFKQHHHVMTQQSVTLALPKALDLAHEELTKKYAGAEGMLFLKKILSNVNHTNNLS